MIPPPIPKMLEIKPTNILKIIPSFLRAINKVHQKFVAIAFLLDEFQYMIAEMIKIKIP